MTITTIRIRSYTGITKQNLTSELRSSPHKYLIIAATHLIQHAVSPQFISTRLNTRPTTNPIHQGTKAQTPSSHHPHQALNSPHQIFKTDTYDISVEIGSHGIFQMNPPPHHKIRPPKDQSAKERHQSVANYKLYMWLNEYASGLSRVRTPYR